MKSRNILLGLIAAFLIPCAVSGQNMTSNAISMFGLGEIERGTYGYFGGMGGVGIGMSEINTINNNNPASLSTIQKKSFVLESSIMGKFSHFTAGESLGSENTTNGNIERIAMAFRVSDRVALGFSLVPYTKIGYTIKKDIPVEGTFENDLTIFTGSGGLNKINLTAGINILPKLTFGVNTAIYFGNLTQKEKSETWAIYNTSQTSRVNFDFGLQYSFDYKENTKVTLGVVGGLKAGMSMHNSIEVINSDNVTVEDKGLKNTKQYIPMFVGAGLGVKKGNKIMWGVDYRFQQWSKTVDSKNNNNYWQYKDSHQVIAGMSYTPNHTDIRNYFNRVTYQFGVNVSTSYISIKGYTPIEYSVTMGAIMPLRQTLNSSGRLTVAMEYGKMGARKETFFREDFLKLSIGFTFAESWFVRHKFK